MKVTIQDKEIEFTQVSICAKCADLCTAQLISKDNVVVAEHEGYVPPLMPDKGGDYVTIDIDLETGVILNWKRPTRKIVEETKWTLA